MLNGCPRIPSMELGKNRGDCEGWGIYCERGGNVVRGGETLREEPQLFISPGQD